MNSNFNRRPRHQGTRHNRQLELSILKGPKPESKIPKPPRRRKVYKPIPKTSLSTLGDFFPNNKMAPSMWSTIIPHLQVVWDSTSLSLLKECPRKYQLRIIEGHVSRIESADLTWGAIYHSALETYERSKAQGNDFPSAQRDAVRHVLKATWDFALNRPWQSPLPHKTRETLLRSVIWYLEKYRDDPVQTVIFPNGQPAVEISFRFETGIFTRDDEPFSLCGHLDRVGTMGHPVEPKTWILDYKTTGKELTDAFFDQFNPHNQMSTYDLTGTIIFPNPIEGIIIDACETKVGFSRFRRDTTHRTEDLRAEWHSELNYWFHTAQHLALTYGPSPWPKNDTQCRYCAFRDVCAETPKMRPSLLSAGFTQRPWNPTETREKPKESVA